MFLNFQISQLIFVYDQTEKEVIKILTQVAVTKREQEINLDEQDFGEKKRINKRKKLIEKGLDPEEADREIEADIEWKRRKGDKSSKTRKRKGAHNLKFKVRVRLFSMFDICTPYNWEKMNLFCRIWLAK